MQFCTTLYKTRYSEITMTLLQARPLLIEDSAGMIESSSSLLSI